MGARPTRASNERVEGKSRRYVADEGGKLEVVAYGRTAEESAVPARSARMNTDVVCCRSCRCGEVSKYHVYAR
jgi:hypothetical protein